MSRSASIRYVCGTLLLMYSFVALLYVCLHSQPSDGVPALRQARRNLAAASKSVNSTFVSIRSKNSTASGNAKSVDARAKECALLRAMDRHLLEPDALKKFKRLCGKGRLGGGNSTLPLKRQQKFNVSTPLIGVKLALAKQVPVPVPLPVAVPVPVVDVQVQQNRSEGTIGSKRTEALPAPSSDSTFLGSVYSFVMSIFGIR